MADTAKPGADAAEPSTPAKVDSAAAAPAAPAAPAPSTPGMGSDSTPPTPSTPGGGFLRTSSGTLVRKLPASFQFPEEIEAAFTTIQAIMADADKTSCGFLDAAQVQGAITRVPALENELSPEALKLSIEHGDTDGTGDKINYAKVKKTIPRSPLQLQPPVHAGTP